MNSRRLSFPGALGHPLAARLDLPAGEPCAHALFAHCFTCSKDLKAVGRISRSLAERGIAVLRFDFTGLGESEGDFADTNFSSNLEDLRAAVAFLRDHHRAPGLMIGHSLGGAAILRVAVDVPEVRAVATLGAPSDTQHLRRTLLRSAPELEEADEAEITLAGRPFRIRRQLLEDLGEQSVLEAVGRLRKPLMIFHSPTDEVVGIDHARRLYEAAQHPKSFVSLDGADHLLLAREADARFVGEMLVSWAGRYFEPAAATEAGAAEEGKAEGDKDPGEPLEKGEVRVRGGAEGLAQEIRVGRHRLAGDEPVDLGGTDTGPTPYDFLLAALGACTSMTLRLYADRKSWGLEGVEVRLRHGRIHAEDCADCETKKGRVDRIERQIALFGELDDAQRERLLEIADRCPVHRTLTSEIVIESRLL